MKVLVSGGSKGIGLAIARAFAAETPHVGICARGEAGIAAALAGCPTLKGIAADVSREDDCGRLAAWAGDALGGIDVLVNNAGVFHQGGILDQTSGQFDAMLDANLRSAIHLTRACVPMLSASPHATIINIASVASIKGYPTGVAYAVAKHGMLGLSRSLREELKPRGIAVVALLPGATETDSWAASGLPSERFMRPDDIAQVAVLAHRLSKTAVLEEVVMRPFLGDI